MPAAGAGRIEQAQFFRAALGQDVAKNPFRQRRSANIAEADKEDRKRKSRGHGGLRARWKRPSHNMEVEEADRIATLPRCGRRRENLAGEGKTYHIARTGGFRWP